MENLILATLKGKSLTFEELKKELGIDDENLNTYIKKLLDEEKIIFDGEKLSLAKKKKKNKFEPILDKDYILDILSTAKPIGDICKACHASKNELEPVLEEMINEGTLGKFHVYYCKIDTVTISISESGIVVGRSDKSYRLEGYKNIYDGDICQCLVIDEFHALFYKLIKRGHDYVVGELIKKTKKDIDKYYIKSSVKRFKPLIKIEESNLNGAVLGEIVTADLIYKNDDIWAKVTNVIGHKDDPGMEISKIALEFGFILDFNEEVKEELKEIPENISNENLDGRCDFRDLNIITIDGADSKDFDDAIYLEVLPDGNYKLGVYIADVSHYVKYNSPLDKEALKRGTSVYLADRVIPMLPHKLSNGICSLNPHEDRFVLACIMEYQENGKLVNYEIVEGIINSHHRMTYEDVNKIFSGDKELIDKYQDIYPMLNLMRDFSKKLRKIREKKGALEFDTVEYSFRLNEDGSPKEIIKRERFDSEMLIEDFMLEANQTIAYHMNLLNLPIIYRIHENPDQDRLSQTFDEIRSLGVKFKNIKNEIHPKEIQTILKSLDDNPNKDIITNMLLRSMMKAKYSDTCMGHYGLAMKYYCHFTSPIRRYPDLMTHRMIKELLLHPGDNFNKKLKYYSAIMNEIAMRNSMCERKSVDCEREVNDMLYAWYMESNIGKLYTGVITSMTNFGIFIDLGSGIEGLFLYKMSESHYDYDESQKLCFCGRRRYKLGDKIKVTIIESSKERREILVLPEGDVPINENNSY
ncbi:MAG: ribonuclease R [Acholeplasmatales bacterium]|nr:ribonuclease R [Acholeplasmatales bacterium]